MIGRAIMIALLLAASAEVHAATLVVTTSTERIEIASNFTGGGVTVFGAIEDWEDINADHDIIVILRGPDETVTTRRKERVLGLWLNRGGETFVDIASFYAVHSNRPLSDIANPDIRNGLGLGLTSLVPGDDEFADAFIRLRQEADLFVEENGGVERIGNTVFQTAFALPADVPIGDFTVEVFLFQEGRVLDYTVRSLAISKSGAEQFIHEASLDQPWLYALVVIAIAMAAGWLGGVIFRRD